MGVEENKAKANSIKPRTFGKVTAPANSEPKIEDVVEGTDFYPPDDGKVTPSEEDGLTAKNIDDMKNYFMALQNPLAAPDVRERIESKLEPLNIGELMLTEEVRQEIPITQGLVVVFRTLTAAEDLYIRSTIVAEGETLEIVDAKRSLYSLAMGIHRLNGEKITPWHLTESGIDTDAVEARVSHILKFPVPIVSFLSVNYSWFQDRVTSLLSGEEIVERVKNG